MGSRAVTYLGTDPQDIPDPTGQNFKELGVSGNAMFWSAVRVNPSTISQNTTIKTGSNAMVAGPITIADGVTVTIEDGATLVIV